MRGWRRAQRPHPSLQPSLPGIFEPLATRFRRLATPHEQALDVARSRLIAAVVVFSVAYLVIAIRLADLTLFNEAPEQSGMRAEISNAIASRADITDRNGVVLATSMPTQSLCADTKKLLNKDDAVKQLLTVLPDLDEKKLAEDLNRNSHCVPIHRHLTPKQYYAINKLGIAGLEFLPDEGRIYPAGNVAAHLVGYTDIDNRGLAGMEDEFNMKLDEQQEPVALSVDLRVQTIMHNQLAGAMDAFHANGAAGLVMDISTGEILAMVSLPDFDPMHAGDASSDERFNRDTLGVYEMGSTFKVFNTALALDSGLIHPADTFDTTHPLQAGNQLIRDFETEKRWLNVAEIFTHSSNIGAARMADRLGGARQRTFLARLGLTEKQPLELPENGAPLVPNSRSWSDITTETVAFGHGIAVNSVQLAGAVATVVNDGVPVHPTLLKKSAKDSAAIKGNEHVISPHTSALMRAMMRLVVTTGTAKTANVPGYLLGGKTGTANKIVGHGYTRDARLSSFIGVFPMDSPHYLVFAMLDDPKANAKTYGFATGGWTAAPVVSKVVSQIGPLLGVTPYDVKSEQAAEKQVLKPLGALVVDGVPVDEGSSYASIESHSVR